MKRGWLRNVAYGRPKRVKEIPAISNVAADVGVRVFQVLRARPLVFGYKTGRGRR